MRSIILRLAVLACAVAIATLAPQRAAAERVTAEPTAPPNAVAAAERLARTASVSTGDDVIRYAGGTIKVQFNDADFQISRRDLLDWVRQSARATAAYFGRFPVANARIVFEPTRGASVEMGRATGRPEPRITVIMGRRTTAAELAEESLLVHEMTHLAIPDHDARYLWLHEGIATYVENIARAQAGLVSPRDMWAEFLREMPDGLPRPRETAGLDSTPSDQRRYWGGALFCLLADIEIRRATGNRLGLQDALRGVRRQGGDLTRMWPFERTIQVADSATGTTVLAQIYRTMGPEAHRPDLDRLWRDLGVSVQRGKVVLDDTAPLAAIRRAITDKPSAPLLIAQPRLVRAAHLSGRVSGHVSGLASGAVAATPAP